VSDQEITVVARPRTDGIDIERLALALLEVVERLPARQRDRLAAGGEKLIAAAKREVQASTDEGAA